MPPRVKSPYYVEKRVKTVISNIFPEKNWKKYVFIIFIETISFLSLLLVEIFGNIMVK